MATRLTAGRSLNFCISLARDVFDDCSIKICAQWNTKETIMKFNTTEDATAYLNANDVGYSLKGSTAFQDYP